MFAFAITVAVSFLLGWRLGKYWFPPVLYILLALALGLLFDPTAGPGEPDVARWVYALFGPIVPALAAAIGTVLAKASEPPIDRPAPR